MHDVSYKGMDIAPGQILLLLSTFSALLSTGGDGIWPAFWMLPAPSANGSLAYGAWPASGEIDIVEAVNDMSSVMGTVHFGDPQGQLGGQLTADFSSGAFANAYHVYAVDWSWDTITW